MITPETPLASHFLTMLYLKKYSFQNTHSAGQSMGFPNSCIGYVLQGNVSFFAKTETLHAKEGEVIYIPKGQKYHSRWSGTPEIEFYSLNFEFRSNVYPGDPYPFQTLNDTDGSVRRALERIDQTLNKKEDFAGIGEFYLLQQSLSRRLTRSDLRPEIIQVREAVQFIETHCLSDFNNGDLARLCNLSESRFYHLFKTATGLTPVEYKNRVRIQEAMNYLLTGSHTIEWISAQLNFSSPAYFRKVLRAVVGKTPRELRREIHSI